MKLFVPSFDWAVIDKEVIAMGTCRAVRAVRVGRTFMVESGELIRDAAGVPSEHWKVVAVAKGERAYQEAMEWLENANVEIMALIMEDVRDRTP